MVECSRPQQTVYAAAAGYDHARRDLRGDELRRELLRREQQTQIVSALDRIAERQPIAFWLYYLEECTHPEIAECLELSRPTIDSPLRRGLQGLRTGLQPIVS